MSERSFVDRAPRVAPKKFSELFVRVVRLVREMGMIKPGTIALDGIKVRPPQPPQGDELRPYAQVRSRVEGPDPLRTKRLQEIGLIRGYGADIALEMLGEYVIRQPLNRREYPLGVIATQKRWE